MSRLAPLILVAYLAVSFAVAWGAWRLAVEANLAALREAATIRVVQAADRLSAQLAAYRVLVNMLADHPVAAAALAGEGAAEDLLIDAILTFGAEEATLLDRKGKEAARAGRISPHDDDAALLRAALNGRMGLTRSAVGGRRQFRLSRGVRRQGEAPVGAILISVDVADLEFEWSVDPDAIVLVGGDGSAFSANRPALIGVALGGEEQPLEVGEVMSLAILGLPAEALVVSAAAPQIGLIAYGFPDVTGARAAAAQTARLAAALMGVLGLIGVIGWLWRRRLADRLAIETRANANLEARVEERTAELRATQGQLVQATKMTALGQMSAGISHELNQPLAAIRNFAENGALLIDRDRRQDARGNFSQISGQVARIDRIIRNLRGFARDEREPLVPVDLADAARGALALTRNATEKAGVVPDVAISGPLWVKGGEVRLQQVIVNLITNAIDAMAGAPDPRLWVTLVQSGGEARLIIRDNGPGVAEPERVFEPFYTTKELGASKGLGLGLSISHGIVAGFGGELICENGVNGAVFTISLPVASP